MKWPATINKSKHSPECPRAVIPIRAAVDSPLGACPVDVGSVWFAPSGQRPPVRESSTNSLASISLAAGNFEFDSVRRRWALFALFWKDVIRYLDCNDWNINLRWATFTDSSSNWLDCSRRSLELFSMSTCFESSSSLLFNSLHCNRRPAISRSFCSSE